MNLYISGKLIKDSVLQGLKSIGSPLAELYKAGYPKTAEQVPELLDDFFSSREMQAQDAGDMQFDEAQALINWIYRACRNSEERFAATKELMQHLADQKNLLLDIEYAAVHNEVKI